MKRMSIFLALLCALVLTVCGLSPGRAEYEMSQDAAASTFQREADETTDNRNGLREAEIQELVNDVRVLHKSMYNEWERENEDCILHLDCVPDAESALLFGDALLRQFQRDGSFHNYAPQQISYQADPEIWIISCWEDLGPDSTSASVNFAIRADDAQVVSIYLSE